MQKIYSEKEADLKDSYIQKPVFLYCPVAGIKPDRKKSAVLVAGFLGAGLFSRLGLTPGITAAAGAELRPAPEGLPAGLIVPVTKQQQQARRRRKTVLLFSRQHKPRERKTSDNSGVRRSPESSPLFALESRVLCAA